MHYADSKCTYREIYQPEHGYEFSGPCIVTGQTVKVFVPGAALYNYRQGAHIQDAMPTVSAEDREFLLSGMSKQAWDDTFKDDDDE